MPDLDGLELLRRMRENKTWVDIPVIMCTVVAAMETVHQAAALGARHYMLKPINAGQFIQKVRFILMEKEMYKSADSEEEVPSQELSNVESADVSDSS